MGQMVVTARDGVMADIIAADAIFDPAAVFVGVATAITPNGYLTVIGDVTEPTGDPGTRQSVTAWSTPYTMADGRRVVDGPALEFRPGDDTEATTVIGWFWATLVTAGALLEFGFFDGPIPLPDENAVVTIVPRLTVDPNGNWEASVVIDG